MENLYYSSKACSSESMCKICDPNASVIFHYNLITSDVKRKMEEDETDNDATKQQKPNTVSDMTFEEALKLYWRRKHESNYGGTQKPNPLV
tara:strand:+ start:15507 stop:15779 length:273 start_codon:yes stop_codon:yes gene_type:complete